MNDKSVPILLIGLGGIGSNIVDETYGRLKNEGKIDFLEAMVFDTDQGEGGLGKLKYVPKDFRIQTSTDKTVGYVLENDKNAQVWFPVHPRINNMRLIDGAGQIRAISRLALRSAMKEGKLAKVDSVKERLYRLGGNAADKGVRIMIISSMMGGTGSGMFLQLPLYLRDVMESLIGADRIEIQGTFLLPDVLKGSVDGEQKKNIYANAYAAMREMNAIIGSLTGEWNGQLDLEYKPNQINETGSITIKEWPYDYCYIYDKEDDKGRNLNGISDYIKMISSNLYYQVYGPISDELNSFAINEVRSIIRGQCKNIFGGLSIGKLVYPYDEICDYITNRVIQENLSDQYLKIDTSYKNAMAQVEKSIQEGLDVEKPILENHYIEMFDQLAENKTNLFFKNIVKQIYEFNDSGEKVSSKYEDYETYLNTTIDNAIKEFYDANKVSFLRDSDIEDAVVGQLKSLIDNNEVNLKEFKGIVDAKIDSKGEIKAENDFEFYEEEKESIFDKFLKKDDNYINPVGIRYILYKMRISLNRRNGFVLGEIEKLDKLLKKYQEGKCLDVFPNTSTLKDALQHAINADKIPTDKFTFKSMKKFKEAYMTDATNHINNLRKYTGFKFATAFYRRSLEIINALISEYEGMFDKFDDQRKGIDKKIAELAVKHEESYGKNDIYVLGTKQFKEKIWEKIPIMTRINTFSNVLPKELHAKLKVNCKHKLKGQLTNLVMYETLFNTLVIEGCKESLKNEITVRELLDINIAQALSYEYNYSKEINEIPSSKTYDEYVGEKVKELTNKTKPFCPDTQGVTNYAIWGLNPNSRLGSEISSDESILEKQLKGYNDLPCKVKSSEVYSKYEVIFLHSRYGLKIDDFVKFKGEKGGTNNGFYYDCYHDLIDKISEDDRSFGRNVEITPHLDKAWHTILPEIGEGDVEFSNKELSRAFIVGLPLNYILIEKNIVSEGKYRLEFKRSLGLTAPVSIMTKEGKVQGNLSKLYDGLSVNPGIKSAIWDTIKSYITKVKEDVAITSGKNSIDNDEIIKKLMNTNIVGYEDVNNAVDLLIKIVPEYKTVKEETRNKVFSGLVDQLISVVKEIVEAYVGEDDELIKENTKIILQKMIDSSKLANNLVNGTLEYNLTLRPLKASIE